jgi:hypothetical protein
VLSNGKILPKETPQAIPGLDNFIHLMRQMITAVIGLEPEFFTAVDSGNMTADLFGKKMRQAYKVLAPLLNGERQALRSAGKVMLSSARVVAENYEGYIIPRVNSDGETMELNSDDLSGEYDVSISPVKVTEDEKMEMVRSLIPLSGQLLNKPNPVDITPLIVENWPFLSNRDRKRLEQMMAPPPPPQPDPVNQGLLVAQTKDLEASAAKKFAEAQKLTNGEELEVEQQVADIDKTRSETVENLANAKRKE